MSISISALSRHYATPRSAARSRPAATTPRAHGRPFPRRPVTSGHRSSASHEMQLHAMDRSGLGVSSLPNYSAPAQAWYQQPERMATLPTATGTPPNSGAIGLAAVGTRNLSIPRSDLPALTYLKLALCTFVGCAGSSTALRSALTTAIAAPLAFWSIVTHLLPRELRLTSASREAESAFLAVLLAPVAHRPGAVIPAEPNTDEVSINDHCGSHRLQSRAGTCIPDRCLDPTFPTL